MKLVENRTVLGLNIVHWIGLDCWIGYLGWKEGIHSFFLLIHSLTHSQVGGEMVTCLLGLLGSTVSAWCCLHQQQTVAHPGDSPILSGWSLSEPYSEPSSIWWSTQTFFRISSRTLEGVTGYLVTVPVICEPHVESLLGPTSTPEGVSRLPEPKEGIEWVDRSTSQKSRSNDSS
jgi:hypothetical protein